MFGISKFTTTDLGLLLNKDKPKLANQVCIVLQRTGNGGVKAVEHMTHMCRAVAGQTWHQSGACITLGF